MTLTSFLYVLETNKKLTNDVSAARETVNKPLGQTNTYNKQTPAELSATNNKKFSYCCERSVSLEALQFLNASVKVRIVNTFLYIFLLVSLNLTHYVVYKGIHLLLRSFQVDL